MTHQNRTALLDARAAHTRPSDASNKPAPAVDLEATPREENDATGNDDNDVRGQNENPPSDGDELGGNDNMLSHIPRARARRPRIDKPTATTGWLHLALAI